MRKKSPCPLSAEIDTPYPPSAGIDTLYQPSTEIDTLYPPRARIDMSRFGDVIFLVLGTSMVTYQLEAR